MRVHRPTASAVVLAAGVVASCVAVPTPASVAAAQGQVEIRAVSTDARRVTAGDVLLEIEVPDADATGLRVTAGAADVTAAFAPVADRTFRGLVTGLPVGRTTIVASVDGARRDVLRVDNHPVAGPVFSGAHQEPFYCETEAAGLGAPVDDDCFAPTQVVYRYRRTNGQFAELLDPDDRPADLATVTIDGEELPFIVRLERGVINRGIYEIAALHDGADPSPLRDETGWNGKVVMTFGGGCNVGYHQGDATAGVLVGDALSRGFAVASNSLLVNETNCNPVLAAETAMMTKERLTEVYGPVTHTIGLGGSGGAIMQYTITHAYPGILDGLLPIISYADAVSNAGPPDCALLAGYLATPEGAQLTPAQRQAIGGHQLFGVCNAWVLTFANRIDATTGCPSIVPRETWYHPVNNPTGVRCSLADHLIKQLGADPKTGFARATFDNDGVQYGLAALEAGVIDVEEFLDLNENIGGFDADGLIQSERSIGDRIGIQNAHRHGLITSGLGGLAHTPMIDLRAYTDFAGNQVIADIHTSFWSVAMHERLVRDGVDPAIHSRWIYQQPDGATRIADALDAMDAWLTAIAADTAPGTPAEKAARNRPPEAAPGCWPTPGGAKVEDLDACYSGPFTYTGDLRTVAGAPITSDVVCHKQRPSRSDYSVTFTTEQWRRLLGIFPNGVCDYSRRGVGQAPLANTWQSYD